MKNQNNNKNIFLINILAIKMKWKLKIKKCEKMMYYNYNNINYIIINNYKN